MQMNKGWKAIGKTKNTDLIRCLGWGQVLFGLLL